MNIVILVIVLIATTFLRLSNIYNQINFDGEVALNYLEIKNYINSSTIPLIGPPTGHSWISLGPLFYWIMIPINKIFGFDPIIAYILFALMGIGTTILVFFIVSKIVDQGTAIIATIFIGLSPYWLIFFRYARFYLFAIPLTFIFIYYYTKGLSGKIKHLYISFFILGVIFNFHLSVIALIFASLATITIFRRDLITFKNIIYSAVAFLIPNIPFLIINFQTKFDPLIKLFLWIPYRFIKLII